MGHFAPQSRRNLVEKLDELRRLKDEWIRRQVLVNGRIDVLMTEVLGLECRSFHLAILQHQERFRDRTGCQVVGPRGGGKTKAGTVARCVFEILRNRDIRICLASRSSDNFIPESLEIRRHFEANEDLRRIFGDYVGKRWDSKAWEVSGRKPGIREPTITVIGVESMVASKHYDMLLVDDVQDLEWARTVTTRERIHNFFYTTLKPCLEPDGVLYVLGTRYHYLDHIGHLQKNEMAGERTLIIPSLKRKHDVPDDAEEKDKWVSFWPEKFSVETLLKIKSEVGPIAFESQYQGSADLMRGEIFDFDDFVMVNSDAIPKHLPRYLGTDLAISEKTKADNFAVVVIAYDRETDSVWVVDAFAGKRSFVRQREMIVEWYDRHQCIKGLIEAVAYQAALFQEVKRFRPDLRLLPYIPREDKVTRAWRQQARVAEGRVYVKRGLDRFVEEMVLFPGAKHDDLVDAYNLAVTSITARRRKKRAQEPGLI